MTVSGDDDDRLPLLGSQPARMFSRRHHRAIAEVLVGAIERLDEDQEFAKNNAALRVVVSRLSILFLRDNPSFDGKWFLDYIQERVWK